MGRRACGGCWICFHEKEYMSTSSWLGGGMRERKKMASESRFRDKGGKRRRTYCPTLLRRHDLGFRKLFRPFSIRPMAPGVRDDYDRLQFFVRRRKALQESMRVLRGRGIWPRSWFWTLAFDSLKESRAGLRSESPRNGDRRMDGDVKGESGSERKGGSEGGGGIGLRWDSERPERKWKRRRHCC
jgi:hypothetical protein